MDNSEHPIHSENQIRVRDHGKYGSPSGLLLSQYLSPPIAARLLDPQHRRTLSTLDGEISSTDAIITALKTLSLFKRRVRNCYILISTLPPEILGEIFVMAINDDVRSGVTRPLMSTMAMTVCGVCSFWRDVAWSLPRLWAVLCFRISHPTNSEKEAEIIHQWLARAKGHALTIKIVFEDEVAWIGETAPRDIVVALRMFSSTWHSVQLVLPETWYRPLRSITSLPWLEALALRPINPNLFHPKMLRGFSNAPKLSVLRYDGFFLNGLQVHWGNITKAMIGGPSLDEVVEVLARCPKILYLHLMDLTEARATFPLAPAYHESMEELYITTSPDGAAQGVSAAISAHSIIDLLTTPALRKVHLTLRPMDMHDPLPHISDLIRRSLCPLTTVEVFGRDLGDESVLYFLGNSRPVLHLVNN